jgi:hypothetical protein
MPHDEAVRRAEKHLQPARQHERKRKAQKARHNPAMKHINILFQQNPFLPAFFGNYTIYESVFPLSFS